jgi:ABC-2 type transport system permease protein
MIRYLRLFTALARYSLLREMAFRGNFLAKVFIELLWLAILLIFYRTVFGKTRAVAEWTEMQYLFFLGCHYALAGVMETFFLENCSEFAELVRSGDLDFALLKPIDEQFLLSCRKIDWSTAPNVVAGLALMGVALWHLGEPVAPMRVAAFVLVFLCGIAISYSFLLMLTSTSVWLVRNQSLYEMWWLFSSLMRYPRQIFGAGWARPFGWFFTYIFPAMLVVNVPAETMVQVFQPWFVGFTVAATVVLLVVSRWLFRLALRSYRSASS